MKAPIVNPLPTRFPLPSCTLASHIRFNQLPNFGPLRHAPWRSDPSLYRRRSNRQAIHALWHPSERPFLRRGRRGHVAIARLREGRHRHRERADRLGSGQARRRGWIQRPRRRRRKSSHVRIGRYGQDRQAVGRGGRERWTRWNVESIEAFGDIETRSGVDFFQRCGSLACGTGAFVERPARLLEQNGVPHARLESGADVTRRFPFLSVPATHVGVVDDVGGFVDPGAMIRAQNALTVGSGRGDVRAGRGDARRGGRRRPGGGAARRAASRRGRTGTSRAGARHHGGGRRVRRFGGGGNRRGVHRVAHPLVRTEPGRGETGADDDDVAREPGRELGAGARARLEAYRPSRGGDGGCGEGAAGRLPTVKYQFAPAPSDDGGSSRSRNEAMSVYVLPPIWYPDGVLGLDPGGT